MLNTTPQSNINDTLEELNSQQNARLSKLIENLLEQQQELINTLLNSQYQSGLNPAFDAKPELQDLLIDGELVSPIDSITQRMQLTERYLNNVKDRYKNDTWNHNEKQNSL
jgi:aconitase B